MLFVPDISPWQWLADWVAVVALSDAGMPGNDKAVARPTSYKLFVFPLNL